jgi:hypothetical protein
VLVVVAGRGDKKARDLAERWAPWGAAVLTSEDLSVAGWRYLLDDPEDSGLVIDGQAVAAREITGVLTRLAYVPEHELRRILPEDRDFAAAEMTAFLLSWLTSLRCPVLNRPTPASLAGPGWRHEQWVHTAGRLGVPVQPVAWRLEYEAETPDEEPAPPDVTVTVVGSRCLGTADDTLVAQARRLAAAAGANLLAVRFNEVEDGFRLHSADPWADVSSPEVAGAILEHFREAGRC